MIQHQTKFITAIFVSDRGLQRSLGEQDAIARSRIVDRIGRALQRGLRPIDRLAVPV